MLTAQLIFASHTFLGWPDAEKDVLWEFLSAKTSNVSPNVWIVIAGDLNGYVAEMVDDKLYY